MVILLSSFYPGYLSTLVQGGAAAQPDAGACVAQDVAGAPPKESFSFGGVAVMSTFEVEGELPPTDPYSPGSDGNWTPTGDDVEEADPDLGIDDYEEDEAKDGCFLVLIKTSAALMLYICNVMMWLLSVTTVVAMVIAFKDVDEQVAEIVVMGVTLAFLALCSVLGIWGTFTKRISLLQMCAFSIYQS